MSFTHERPDDHVLDGYDDAPWKDVFATVLLMVWGYGMVLLMGVVA